MQRLEFLHDSLLGLAEEYGWNLQAWAVFSNHYHFVAMSPPDAESWRFSLRSFIRTRRWRQIAGIALPAVRYGSNIGIPT